MLTITLILIALSQITIANFDNETTVFCVGKQFPFVSLAAYYTDLNDENGNYRDNKGKKLRSLQEYLDNQSDFITLAMDEKLGISYGSKVCIPELNAHFGHKLNFEVRDTGNDLFGMSYLRADIFVRSETDSYDDIVNKKVTLVFENY